MQWPCSYDGEDSPIAIFIWGAPRIHGELLMLRFYRLPSHRVALHALSRQTANTVVADFSSQSSPRSASIARSRRGDPRARMFGPIGLSSCNLRPHRLIAAVGVELGRGLGYQHPARNARRVSLRSAQRE